MNISREQIEAEARAKMIWGEPKAAVYSYLRTQGLPPAEAKALLAELQAERTAEVRATGIRNILLGSLLVVSPFAFWMISAYTIGRIYLYVFAATVITAFYGVSKLIDGIKSLIAPKSDSSDLSQE
jgi:predicted phage tail protein